ncbi:MAG: hypothetical protein Q6368_004500 [Candidatus Baldrarchaeota archaeon]
MVDIEKKILELLNEPYTPTELSKKLGINSRIIVKLLKEMVSKRKDITSKKIGRYTVFWRPISATLEKIKNLEKQIKKLEEENKNLREKLLKPDEIDKLWLKLEKWRNYAFKLADFLAFQKGTTVSEILKETGAPLEDENS